MTRLLWLMVAVGSVVFVLVLLLLLTPWIRRRRSTGPTDEELRTDVPAEVSKRWILTGGVLLPVVVLTATLAYSVVVARDIPQEAPDGAVSVELVAHQFWWSATYPEAGVTAEGEVHLPVGERVELNVTSADVIHSLWVPELARKVDALPDGTNTIVVETDEPGRYKARCAEFCGLHHTEMVLVVVAEPRDRFETWLAGQ